MSLQGYKHAISLFRPFILPAVVVYRGKRQRMAVPFAVKEIQVNDQLFSVCCPLT
jgi:hypothetical protein